jgi:hypothetical protein
MENTPSPAPAAPPAPRPAVSFARMLVLAQRRFRAAQKPTPAAA